MNNKEMLLDIIISDGMCVQLNIECLRCPMETTCENTWFGKEGGELPLKVRKEKATELFIRFYGASALKESLMEHLL